MGKNEHTWLSRNPSKRSGEIFHISWTVLWISFFGYVVVSEVYKNWTDVGYMCCGLLLSIPNLLWPNLVPSDADKNLPWHRRYATRSWLWVAIFNFIANYFFTQYFFVLLGCWYSFPVTWMLNKVPIALYLITQSYFQTYFLLSNIMIRKLRSLTSSGIKNYTMHPDISYM